MNSTLHHDSCCSDVQQLIVVGRLSLQTSAAPQNKTKEETRGQSHLISQTQTALGTHGKTAQKQAEMTRQQLLHYLSEEERKTWHFLYFWVAVKGLSKYWTADPLTQVTQQTYGFHFKWRRSNRSLLLQPEIKLLLFFLVLYNLWNQNLFATCVQLCWFIHTVYSVSSLGVLGCLYYMIKAAKTMQRSTRKV